MSDKPMFTFGPAARRIASIIGLIGVVVVAISILGGVSMDASQISQASSSNVVKTGHPVTKPVDEPKPLSERFETLYDSNLIGPIRVVIRDKKTNCEYLVSTTGYISVNISPNCKNVSLIRNM